MSDVNIHIHSSVPEAFLVNSFLVETANGVVVVDTQFLVTPAEKLKQKVSHLGKPLLAVIITHPHPDHYNGTAILLEGLEPVPIYATQATYEGVRDTEAAKREFWAPTYKDEYPKSTLLPTHILKSGEPLLLDGVKFVIDDLGAGEASDINVIHLPEQRLLIASDLIYYKVHPWLAESRSHLWLEQLVLVKQRYGDVVQLFNGHGKRSTIEAIDEQIEYITFFRNLVDRHRQNESVDAEQKAEIRRTMLERYPTYPLDFLIELNVDGVAKELAA